VLTPKGADVDSANGPSKVPVYEPDEQRGIRERGSHVTDLVRSDLLAGAPIEVFNDFLGHWVSGFVVVQPSGDGYRIRRISDRAALPLDFASTAVRSVPDHPGFGTVSGSSLTRGSASRTPAG